MDPHLDMRRVDSYCPTCQDVVPHEILPTDPGACACIQCGGEQQMMVPVAEPGLTDPVEV